MFWVSASCLSGKVKEFFPTCLMLFNPVSQRAFSKQERQNYKGIYKIISKIVLYCFFCCAFWATNFKNRIRAFFSLQINFPTWWILYGRSTTNVSWKREIRTPTVLLLGLLLGQVKRNISYLHSNSGVLKYQVQLAKLGCFSLLQFHFSYI